MLAIIVFAWAYLIYQHWQMTSLPMSEMWMPPAEVTAWKLADFALVYLMRAAMMTAMMLPSAIPMILAFSHVTPKTLSGTQKYSFLFIYGYLLVWLVFSIGMTLLQWQLHGLKVYLL